MPSSFVRRAALAALFTALFPLTGLAECESIARAVSVQGVVEWRRPPSTAWQALTQDAPLCAGDAIRTGANSRASISLQNRSVLRLRESTELTLEAGDDDESVLDMLKGAGHFLTRSGSGSLQVETPFTTAGVRGTEFSVSVEDQQAQVSVFEGSVAAENPAGSLLLAAGQSAVAAAGQAPVLRVVAKPRDAVQWTLHYPPVVGTESGNLAEEIARLDAAEAASAQDPRFFTQRASLLLGVGDVDAARTDLDRALALAPGDPDALALQTVMAVAQGRPDDAEQLSQRAVESAPGSSAAWIARSYAQQSRFDLEGARASLRKAVEMEPQNAVAWARLAEIETAFGRLGAARDAADEATRLDPELSRTQTVLGFIALMRLELTEARWAFQRAMSLDQADPLPRLGSGLLKIREGNLEAGAREIEIAASLDPGNSLVRSYLGKAYFDEKRTGIDQREWDQAKQLDPNDPTPWFYSAIARQTTNEPVVALHEMQEAIARNDDRAVYRSRLLLDSDAAARSASQGRIFGDLGFQQLALVQGWKSVAQDPNDFSGHRLLADSYASQPRHEIARVSELMQSQLLQPLNTSAIQPRHGEGSLFLLSSQGPTNLSFNEFNSLFNRNQLNGQLRGLGGEDETWTGAGIASGIYQRLSFSAGYDRSDTDGFRANNDQDDGVGTGFAQLELGPQTSVQAEIRRRDIDAGDLELRFFEDDFSRFLDEDTTATSARGGVRHSFSPNHTVLLSYIHQDADTKFSDFIPDPLFGDFSIDLDLDETANTGEGQYRYRSDPLDVFGLVQGVNAIAGGGYADVDVHERTRTQITLDPFPPIEELVGRHPDVTHANGYLYSTLALAGDVALTLGVSGDAFDEDEGVGDESGVNPKAGVTWSPRWLRGTTFRAAAFRTLKRTLVTDQTLEPTQVAGFNQFFDDPNATRAWRYGVAVDQVVTKSLFAGIELSRRDLDTPQGVFGAGGFESQDVDWEEELARAYLFATPCDWVALRAEYRYERFERDPFEDAFGTQIFFAFERVETHSVPFGVQLFHPSGLGAALGATWMHQDGRFFVDTTQSLASGDRSLWVLDAALRYRLPRRYGFISGGVNNFLDEDGTYQATDVRNPHLRPGRFAYGSITLAFP